MVERKRILHDDINVMKHLTFSWRRLLSYRNQSIGLLCKSIDWLLYDNDLRYKHLNKGKLHLNDKGISSFVRNFRDFLNVFETVWHEIKHSLFHVSSSSSSCGFLSLPKKQIKIAWELNNRRFEHGKNMICHLNINSIRNKFGTLDEIVKAFNIFLISQSKLDNTFPINQFSIRGYKIFKRDRNRFGGGVILYTKENIPWTSLTDHPVFSDLQLMAFEFHQSKRKWLILWTYKPPSQNDIEFLNISSIIDYYLQTNEKILAIGNIF